MEKLKFEHPGKIDWDYYEEADVLYRSFGKSQPALIEGLGDSFLTQFSESDSELVGFTILDASRLLEGKSKVTGGN